ncbi:transcriptional regulator [Paenibacillus sp. UMB7766-LJ446]|uniref:transcriptional regulator n=1 Tax=Paenibacillus sp. UMB7766-LJ446 TaxID=3046313 RepID=UPI0023D8D5DC|nr:transcriptional regulator [Paenibacillus sp. UMB7766-LJ446]MDK8188679.1 transcriptional regulator [Paenibacillus sp. UMB7766-LJ446]
MIEFGLWLRNSRNKLGISTRQLASVCEVSPSYISQVERGHIQKPSLEVARKIMAALQIENAEQILKQYGFIEADDTFIEINDYETKRNQLIEHLTREIQRMDFEQLEAINLFYKYQDMFMKISKVEKHTSIKVLSEYIDFLHHKYVVNRLKRLFEMSDEA